MSELDVGKELVHALVNRISWLESGVESKKRAVAEAKESAAYWRGQYEEAARERAVSQDRVETAIDRFYEFLGLDRSEW